MRDTFHSLIGTLLISMPQSSKSATDKLVVLICEHTHEGAVGLALNQKIPALYLNDLLAQLSIAHPNLEASKQTPMYAGGDTEMGRGFVLHSQDYKHRETVQIIDNVSLTATTDILKSIANGSGPDQSLFILGYMNWESGALESEVKCNKWLWVQGTYTNILIILRISGRN